MKILRLAFIILLAVSSIERVAALDRPKLRILNASPNPVEVFWLVPDGRRLSSGRIEPGKDRVIGTTLGHRFAIVDGDAESEVESKVRFQAHRHDPAAKDGIPAFYTQVVYAQGYPICASEGVSHYALKEAAFLADLMLANRPDVREAMIASGSRLCILAHDEFAHNIHLRGMANVDPTFDPRVKAAYDDAMKAGLWKGKYASVNHHEYFAEGVQSWFDNNRENDHDHNHVNTRAEMLAYDPALAALCREVFGDTELRYTKPQTRLTGHLAGYDPAAAPKFEWPERLHEARAAILAAATKRSEGAGEAPSGVRFDPVVREIEGWTVHVDPALIDGEHRAEGARALAMLGNHLQRIEILVPAGPLEKMRQVEIWIEHRHPTLKAKSYHPNRDWLVEHGHDPRLAKKVHIPQASDLLSREQMLKHPAVVLHELAHAYHDQVLGFDHPDIVAAYEKAKAGGRYERVLAHTGWKRPHYGMTNHKEYFAEGTEAFFYRNDFYPFVRAEMRAHDPDLLALLETLWEGEIAP